MIVSPARRRSTSTTGFARVVGCGRHLRRDDQLGLCVAQRLAAHPRPSIQVTFSEAPGADLLTDLGDCGLLVVVDAVQHSSVLPAGRWVRFEFDRSRVGRIAAPAVGGEPSHFMGVNAALALGGELGILPPVVWVYAIAGRDFGYGDALSPGLATSVRQLARQIHQDMAAWLREAGRPHA